MDQFEKLGSVKFSKLDIEKMKRVKGGYTLNTVTVYSSGSCGDDGNASRDGISND